MLSSSASAWVPEEVLQKPPLDTYLKAYEDAPALGQTPQELEPQGRAAQEVAGLFSFLSEQASMFTGKHERMKP